MQVLQRNGQKTEKRVGGISLQYMLHQPLVSLEKQVLRKRTLTEHKKESEEVLYKLQEDDDDEVSPSLKSLMSRQTLEGKSLTTEKMSYL